MPTTRLNDIDIYFERHGAGPPLLFCNGSGATVADVAPIIALLSEKFDVAVADARGIGNSGLPEKGYTMADLAHDSLALADHFGWDTFRLMGVSFGGMVAQELAVSAPDRIDRLVLVCTSPGGAGGSSYPLHQLSDLEASERASLYVRILDTRFTPEWLADHKAERLFAAGMVQRYETNKGAHVRKGEAIQLQARAGHDVFERLPLITSPTLIATGRFDGIAPPSNGATIANQIPHAELRVFEGGHLFMIQDPTALPSIVDHLAGDRTSR